MTDTLPSKTGPVTQSFGSLEESFLGLAPDVLLRSVSALNRLLAHTTALRDLYKKSHWQTSGANFYELHLLFDKHYGEQVALMDSIAERVQTLGGVALALGVDVAEETRLSHRVVARPAATPAARPRVRAGRGAPARARRVGRWRRGQQRPDGQPGRAHQRAAKLVRATPPAGGGLTGLRSGFASKATPCEAM
jgi:hypothetical protein